jgi:hypothetical protein
MDAGGHYIARRRAAGIEAVRRQSFAETSVASIGL